MKALTEDDYRRERKAELLHQALKRWIEACDGALWISGPIGVEHSRNANKFNIRIACAGIPPKANKREIVRGISHGAKADSSAGSSAYRKSPAGGSK